jgi:hypothetical protein
MLFSFRFSCAGILLLAGATPALADPAAGEACAKTLSPPALKIYQAAAPDLKPDTDLASLVRAKTRPMVMAGDMNRATARPAAYAAAACLRSLSQK